MHFGREHIISNLMGKTPFQLCENSRAASILDGTWRVDSLQAFCVPWFVTAAMAELYWLIYTARNKTPYVAVIHDLFCAYTSN